MNRATNPRPTFICLALCTLVFAAACQGEDRTFKLRIPRQVPAEGLVIKYGVRGGGLLVGELRAKKDVWEYEIHLKSTDSITLFAYCPGYEIAFVSNAPLDQPWTPDFRPVSTTTIEGALRDTKGAPVANEHLVFKYTLTEAMGFFGYIDGMSPSLTIAEATTDNEGAFHAKIPLLAEDNFFRTYYAGHSITAAPRAFELSLGRAGTPSADLSVLRPARLNVQTKYESPINLQLVQKARLRGKILPSFLSKNGIVGEVRNGEWPAGENDYRLDLDAESKDGRTHTGYNCMLEPDLTFSVLLPPGQYALQLNEMARGYILQKAVPVKERVILGENEDVNLVAE
jgi:hypothetical protein